MEILESLDPLLQTFWWIALPASLIFVIQTIITFVGVDASDGIEADFDGDFDGDNAPFQLFSFRNLIHFLLGFSWTGISYFDTILNKNILIIVSVIVGCLFVYLFFILMQQIQKLAEDNSFKLSDTLQKTADVYLTIPENKTGKGKIMMSVKGSYRELDAMTENQKITTGTPVKVVKIENESIVIVETL